MTKTVNLSTSVPSVTFTKTGLLVPDEIDILNGRLSDLSTAMGGQMSTSLTSPQGQIAVSDSAIIADKNDQLLAIVNQINPDYASGRFQDAIGRIYFLDRIPASGTTVTARCTGMVGTVIPAGSIARDKTGYLYHSLNSATIPATGSVDIVFQNTTAGPIPCQIGDLDTIYSSVSGWSGILNEAAGVPGANEESRANFEYRRRQSVARNSRNTLGAIRAAVLEVAGLVDAYVISNNSGFTKNTGTSSYPLLPHSIYVGVYGGKADDIANAIWNSGPPGIDMCGNTELTIVDKDGYGQPYPEYVIQWETVKPIGVSVRINLRKNEFLSSNINELVVNAVQDAFNGIDGGTRARIGTTLYAGRYYSGVYNIDQANIDIVSITLSRDAARYDAAVSFGIDEIPTLDSSNIMINMMEV
ncbi:baseplate J/gp47 family protein [Xenorhabdus sp. XENO-10]|uniref:Baseplate J/gp47 family protein n=1 Tax=Xenorhabdus yunnanensis TaxID=3025878 RepID=A0ABT5LIU3_9GAMM|nr:baseplate J/gp47 family protein [Xenorhabdus yunnanensis]MDC9591019.1 baseplate J/gp47 family protein [Xenorhabdus yunnanensis]